MTRGLTVLALSLVLVGCNGDSPAGPTPAPTATRIIQLEADLAFGNIQVGTTFEAVLRIYNRGTEPLTVTGMTGPTGYTSSWTSGTIAPGTSQAATIRFSPTAAQTYNGTLTVAANHTSGANTIPVSGTGQREIFRRSGIGDTVFDMPLDVARVRIIGTYTQNSSNFIVRIGGRTIVNELLGTGWNMTRYDGTLLTGGGGVTEVRLSSGVSWSFEEVR